MTKKKSHDVEQAAVTDELKPWEVVVDAAGKRSPAALKRAPENSAAASIIEPTETHQPSQQQLASDALEHATNLLSDAQHSDFSAPRHRAMQLITEARALLA